MKKPIILLLLLACTLITGCSYMEFEDKLKEFIEDKKQSIMGNETEMESTVQESEDSDDENIKGVGETLIDSVLTGEIEYTLLEVKTGNNIYDLNLKKELFKTDFMVGMESRSIDEVTDREGKLINDTAMFVVATISLKNINADMVEEGKINKGYEDIPFCVECLLMPINQEEYTDANGWLTYGGVEICYFSERPEDNVKGYYYYALETGEEKIVTVAWVIPKEKWNELDHYAINTSNMGTVQYFRLNQE